MASLEANGITIEYEVQGEGPPLLLVMGLGGQLVDWPQGFVDKLAENFTVIRFDNRDSGLSTEFSWEPATFKDLIKAQVTRKRPDAGYLLSDMAADAAGLLRGLDISAAHVVGMSMGGMISQCLAIDHPELVLSLTSIMSTTGNPKDGRIDPKLGIKIVRRPETTIDNAVEESLWMFSEIGGPLWDPIVHRARQEESVARSLRPKGTARQLAAISASPDRTPDLQQLNVPTLVIHGLVDPLVTPSGGIATVKAIPGARLLMFPDMGHDLPEPRWDEMVEAISVNSRRAKRPSITI